MVGVKEFSGLQVFEFVYLMVLAFLPFVIQIQQIAYTILTMVSVVASIALYKKVRYRPFNPHGRTVVITGCDTGFGNAFARRLDKKGFQVIAGCLDDTSEGAIQLKENSSGLLQIVKLDITKPEDIEKCLNLTKEATASRGLWALINNAGVFTFGDLELCPMEEFHKVMNVNVFGALEVTRAFLPLIRSAKGRIITVSGASGLMSFPGQSAFCMTQHSLVAMMDSLRLEMHPFGVKVINIQPGNFVGTTRHLNKKAIEKWQSTFEERKKSLDEEIISAYGQAHWESQQLTLNELSVSSAKNMVKVLDAMDLALLDTRPQSTYLVDGGNQLIDLGNMMIRLRLLLPTWLNDFILVKLYTKRMRKNETDGKDD